VSAVAFVASLRFRNRIPQAIARYAILVLSFGAAIGLIVRAVG